MGESENEKFLKSLRTLIKKRDIEKIKSLISNPRFDVNIRDLTQDLQTPLMKLCYSEINDTNLMTIMDLLLDRNADLNTQDSLGRTAVMHACIARRTTIADYIVWTFSLWCVPLIKSGSLDWPLLHKNIRSVRIGQSDVKHIMTSLVKAITSVLKTLTDIITNILDHPYQTHWDKSDNVCLDLQNAVIIIYIGE